MIVDVLCSAALALGLFVVTIGLLGAVRHGDVYVRLHAASKAVVLGVVLVLLASAATGDGPTIARAVLISGFLLLTTPVSTHAIARAQWARDIEDEADEED